MKKMGMNTITLMPSITIVAAALWLLIAPFDGPFFVSSFVIVPVCNRLNGRTQKTSLRISPNGELGATAPSYNQALEYLTSESINDLLPKEDLIAIVVELKSSDSLMDDLESQSLRVFDKISDKLMQEERSMSEIIGPSNMDSVIERIGSMEDSIYDPTTVNAFLGSDAINSMFAKVLYDGIFEFFQRIDIIGNIINGLPIIGPVRQQINSQFKRELDKTLGPLVQQFLRAYTKVAVQQASDFVLSDNNKKAFSSANARIVASIVNRPLKDLIPTSTVEFSKKLQSSFFKFVKDASEEDIDRVMTVTYDWIGDKRVRDYIQVNDFLEASPTLHRTYDRWWSAMIK